MTTATQELTVAAGLMVREGEIGNVRSAQDGKSLTFDVTWTTGARGARFDWWTGESFDEELAVDASAVRMGRLSSGRAPVLNAHSSYRLENVIGVVEKAWLADGKGHASLRMSSHGDVDRIVHDIRDKIIRNVSVGYRVYKYKDVTPTDSPEGTRKIKRAVDWEPWEISAVPIGFDPDAHTRADKTETYPCVIEETGMPDETKAATGDSGGSQRSPVAGTQAVTAAPAAVADPILERKAGAEAEMTRSRTIRGMVRKASLGEEFADTLIDRGTTVEAAKDAVLEKLSARSAGFAAGPQVTVTRDGWDTFKDSMQNAIEHRVGLIGEDKLSAGGRELRGYRNMELIRESLRVRKLPVDGGVNDLIKRAYGGMQGTSDLPNLFSNVAGKSLKKGWLEAPATYRMIASRKNVMDFKTFDVVGLGEGQNFLDITEHGEIQFGKVTDPKESAKLKTGGRGVTFTREALINDDLDGLSRIPSMFGAAAARYENLKAWTLFLGNGATMGDGLALWNAAHNNTSTGALSETSLASLRAVMRLQKGPDLAGILNITPKYLIVPAALETVADRLVTTITPAESGKVNPFAGKLQPIAEPILDGTSAIIFYMAGDPNQFDVLRYGYLDGAEGPQMESETDIITLGIKMVAYLDFYVMLLDFRALAKSTGA